MKINAIRTVTACALSGALAAACAPETEDAATVAAEAPPPARIGNIATAELRPASGSSVSGLVSFAQLEEALQIDAELRGLSPGPHALHLHVNGDCSAPDASSAGGHFSPADAPHGSPSDAPGEHHAGDLGNVTASADGTASLVHEDAELTLVGDFGVVGRSVIVHRGADDFETQPGGDAGERIACGVIGWGTDAP